MASIDFDAARRERIASRNPVEFTLGGVTFRCRPAIAFENLLLAYEDETRRSDSELYRMMCDFVARCLPDDQVERWRAVLVDDDEPVEEDDVKAVVKFLVGRYAARPTSPSNGSSVGRRKGGSTTSSPGSKRSRAKPKGS